MKIERLKTYLLSVSAGCLLALPWSASAFTVYEDFVSLGSSVPATPVVFEGAMQANMTQCDLELDAELIVYGSTVEINVVGGQVTGGGFCSTIALQGFPWYSATSTSAFPTNVSAATKVPMTFHNVSMTLCGTGSVSLLYSNWDPSQGYPGVVDSNIEFPNTTLGLCTLNGTLLMSGTNYDLVNN